MRRWTLFLPVAALTLFAGWLGLRLGQPVSETEIIERYAALYLSQAGAGARATDCLATAGQGDARMMVICAHPDGTRYEWAVDARGRVLHISGPTA